MFEGTTSRGFGIMVDMEWTGPDGRSKSADALVAVTTVDLDESGRVLLSKLNLQATPVPLSDLVGASSILARMSDVEAAADQTSADAADAKASSLAAKSDAAAAQQSAASRVGPTDAGVAQLVQ